MEKEAVDVAALERRIEYLSVQVERLIELQHPFSAPTTAFRKAAMLQALTFEQEVLARKLLGAVLAFKDGEQVNMRQGLVPFPEETVNLFNEYAGAGAISSAQIVEMLETLVPGGESAARNLLEAWESVQRHQTQ